MEIKKASIQSFTNHLLLFIIIALTGFEYFYRNPTIIYFIFPVSATLFFIRKCKLNLKAVLFITLIFIVLLAHCNKYDLPYSFAFNGLIRFFTYYFIASILGYTFTRTFLNIIFVLCVTSLFFYILTSISSSFYQFLLSVSSKVTRLSFDIESIENWSNPNHTIVIYTIPLIDKLKNNGPFWEPGMFAVFINIALILNLIKTRKLLEIKSIVFLSSSISTFSTTSLITTFIILIYYFVIINRNIYSLIFTISIGILWVPIYNSPYIKGKIDSNIDNMEYSYSRFGAAVFHWEQIKKSPWIGYGFMAQKEQEKTLGIKTVSPNGLTNLIRYFGIPLSTLFFILLYKFSESAVFSTVQNKKHSFILFLIVLLVAFSQDVTTRHFYYMILFIPFVKIKKTQ